MKVPKLKVKNSGVIKLNFIDDFPDGNLVVGEVKKNIPFVVKRVYYINNLFNKGAVRGKHAHKKLKQAIFCLNGSFNLTLDDGRSRQNILMSSPYYGIILGAKLWHTMSKFSSDCVILVLAADYYQEKDYLRNYDDFLNFIKK